MLTCIEICAGAGGQALGLSLAGFTHIALVEYEKEYCETLRRNRPEWNVIQGDVKEFSGLRYKGQIDLLAGGVPCPPFSVAGKQLGREDERDLFPEALRLIEEINPRAVMIENVRGFLDPEFKDYRQSILNHISSLGYKVKIKLLNANDYGVPQLRPRIVIVGIRNDIQEEFQYPKENLESAPTVGETLYDLMKANGWKGAKEWAEKANTIAPTIVGGSKKHGGPDLGPVRAKRAWAVLNVDGLGVANDAPSPDFEGMPRLTPRMIARIQGFPDTWSFGTKKTALNLHDLGQLWAYCRLCDPAESFLLSSGGIGSLEKILKNLHREDLLDYGEGKRIKKMQVAKWDVLRKTVDFSSIIPKL